MIKLINKINPTFRYRIEIICRIIIGIVFIYSSYHKIIDPIDFAKNIHNYNVSIGFLEYFENIVALVLPFLELLVGLFLLMGVFVEASVDIVIFLLLFFIILLAQAYARGINVNCGCFSAGSGTAEASDLLVRIIQDFILLSMSLFIKFNNMIKSYFKNE